MKFFTVNETAEGLSCGEPNLRLEFIERVGGWIVWMLFIFLGRLTSDNKKFHFNPQAIEEQEVEPLSPPTALNPEVFLICSHGI